MERGCFITLEGPEGAGKSTHAGRLAARLRTLGRDVVLTREPGGTAGAEAVRELLVGGPVDRWSARSEALLLYAARSDHLERVISPALAEGKTVVCDRFSDSTLAYQGAAGGASGALLKALEREIVGSFSPSLTLILDLPVAEGLARAAARQRRRGGPEGRFEEKGLDFHERLRAGFLALAAGEPERCVLIDAARGEAEVAAAIEAAVLFRVAA
ncbi:MAG: dTMP kinase [Caulobacteraceae bacterium]